MTEANQEVPEWLHRMADRYKDHRENMREERGKFGWMIPSLHLLILKLTKLK